MNDEQENETRFCALPLERWVRLWWMRFNVILGYLPLLVLDGLIAFTGAMSWSKSRADTKMKLLKIWNRYV